MIKFTKTCVFFILGLFYTTTSFSQTELIVNGNFETGNFNGWTPTNSSTQTWFINNGIGNPDCFNGLFPSYLAPISGNFEAGAAQVGPGFSLLSTGFIVPNSLNSAMLSFDLAYINSSGVNALSPNKQFFMVRLLDASMAVVDTVFITRPTDPASINPAQKITLNIFPQLQTLRGQMAYISIDNENVLDCFPVKLDNVSLIVNAAPIPTLGEWGLVCLFLMMVILGIVWNRQTLSQTRKTIPTIH